MKSELAQMLRADGFSNIAEAIGADARRADKGENVT
jgi:hypothetical protein